MAVAAAAFIPRLLGLFKGAKGATAAAGAAKGAAKAASFGEKARRWGGTAMEYAIPGYQVGMGKGATAGLIGADLAPELIMAGLQGAMLPEGTGMGTRLGAVGEDAGIGMGLSWLGQGLAEAGLRAVERRTGKPLGQGVRYATKAGLGAATMMGGYQVLPRPFAGSAYEKAQSAMEQEMALRRQEEDRQLAESVQQNTINSLFGGYI